MQYVEELNGETARHTHVSAMAAEAFMDLAGLNALTAYQRCVIPTASPIDKALRHNSLVTHIAL